MGNKVTLNPTIPIIREEQWEEIQAMQIQHPEFGQFRTLRNEYTGQLIDEYKVDCIDEDDYQTYLESFTWRLKQDDIVKTMYLKQAHREEFCSKTYIVKVYIQHIGTRLSDITDIPYPQNLYVCMCALRGYQTLYDYLQYFRVEQNQICVDSEGKVRVWINSDLSKNYPNINEETQGADETSMVQQIIQLISENTDQDSQPISLREYFEGNSDRPVGFEEAKGIINEYARQHNVVIPQCFESILEIYQKQEEQSNRDGVEYRNDESRYVGKLSKVSHQPQSSRLKQNLNKINHMANDKKPTSPFQPQETYNNPSQPQHYFHPMSSVRTQGLQKQSSALRHTFREEPPNGHNPDYRQQKISPLPNSTMQYPTNFYKPMSIDISQYRTYQPYQQEIRLPPQQIPHGYPQQYSHFYPPQYYATQIPHHFIANQPAINVLPPHMITQNTSPPKPYSPSPFSKASIDKPQSPIIPTMNVQTNNIKRINQQSIKAQTKNDESYLKEVISDDASKKVLSNKKSQFKKIDDVEKNQRSNEKDKHIEVETQKAYYYTIDTQESLDPQIAADLRRLYPIE